MVKLLNYLCTFLLAKRVLCAEPVFMHDGDCTSGTEAHLGTADSPTACQTMCQNSYGPLCKDFTFAASGNGACYWEESCTSHNDNKEWKGYRVLVASSIAPVFTHDGDCRGNEVGLGTAEDLLKCQALCLTKKGANCRYITFPASGSGECYWEESCTSHNDNTAWKGYVVVHFGDIRCLSLHECKNQILNCPNGRECWALCERQHSCDTATINADSSTSLTVIAKDSYALQSAVVRCPINGQCNVECRGPLACRYTKVYYHDLAKLNVVCTIQDPPNHSCRELKKIYTESAAANAVGVMNIMDIVDDLPVVSRYFSTSPWIMAIGSLLAVLLLINLLMICYKNCGGTLFSRNTPRIYHAVKPIDSEDNEENAINIIQ